MSHRALLMPCALTVLCSLVSSRALAQWSSDPAFNLAVADRSGEQTQSKILPTSDGGCYISWFDNASGGYDVYAQRLDSSGVEQWPHNGVLVADRSFSSTQDYGIAVDADDNLILCYRDDRAGGIQIGVNKLQPDGTLAWGSGGVILSNTSAFIGNTKVAATSDGHYVVGWSEDGVLVLQRLNTDGTPQWAPGGIQHAPAMNSYSLADLHPSLDGSVIASWVHSGGFADPRHLNAQRFDSSGTALWNGGDRVIVFDGGSLQIGYFPQFVPDGSGGAVLAWYSNSGNRDVYLQHLTADGVERFQHNGVPASIEANRTDLASDVVYDAARDDAYVVWVQTNSLQNGYGLYAQRYRAGVRQWGDNGLEIRPHDAGQEAFATAAFSDDVFMAFAFDRENDALVVGYGFNAAAEPLWSGGMTTVCANLTGKSRLDAAVNACGDAILTWGDGVTSSRNILAQNVHTDGTLGTQVHPLGDMNCDGVLSIDDVELFALAVLDADGYAAQQACCDPLNADYTSDGQLAGDDIGGFVLDLTN